jgi:hypothetical protein
MKIVLGQRVRHDPTHVTNCLKRVDTKGKRMPSLARNECQGGTCGAEDPLVDDGEQSECMRSNSVVACLVLITHVTLPNWVYVLCRKLRTNIPVGL